MGAKDVRDDAIQLIKLVRSVDDVEKTLEPQWKHEPKILNSSPTVRSDQ
jgi:hypothetical protein